MYIIGTDIGTTGTKSMLVGKDGRIVKTAYKGYGIIKPGPGAVEQDAAEWWKALVTTVRECAAAVHDPGQISGISLSAQGGSLVAVDGKGDPLDNAIVWMDSRCDAQQKRLLKEYNQDYFYLKTGFRLGSRLNMLQIMRLKDERRDIFDKTYKFLSTVDFINHKLTGSYIIDHTNAGITQLFNLNAKKWDNELLSIAAISEGRLAEISESGAAIGCLTTSAAAGLGLPAGIKVFSGGHDQYCAALGAGAVRKGDVLLSTGTAWVVLGINDSPMFDHTTYPYIGRHIAEGLWGVLASLPTGGVSLDWFRENFHQQLYMEENIPGIWNSQPDLFFFPEFNGSSYPSWNEKTKGTLIGAELRNNKYDITLAVMEGVVFEAFNMIVGFMEAGFDLSKLIICGGAMKSRLWRGIIEAVAASVGCRTVRPAISDLACAGAVILAGKGCGTISSYEDGSGWISSGLSETVEPDADVIRYYEDKFRRYRKLKKKIQGLYEPE